MPDRLFDPQSLAVDPALAGRTLPSPRRRLPAFGLDFLLLLLPTVAAARRGMSFRCVLALGESSSFSTGGLMRNRSIALILFLACVSSSTVLAQNLIPNGEFDTDTVPWITGGSGSVIGWTGIDHGGCIPAVSGALLATNSATAAEQVRGSGACVTDVVGNATYSFGADLRFPTGQTRTGDAQVVVVWFQSPDCTGLSEDSADGDVTVDTSTSGSWIHVRNDAATAPADALSGFLSVRLRKIEAGGSLALAYDGAFLADGVILLFVDDFERQSSCHWSITTP